MRQWNREKAGCQILTEQRVTDDYVKNSGREIRLIVEYLPSPEQNRNETFEEVKRKLNQHFIPKEKKETRLFKRMRQLNKETISEFAMRLKEQTESCKFGNNKEDRILEQLIQTIEENSEMRRKTIQKQWNFNKFLKEEASQWHDLKREVKEITRLHTNTINGEDQNDKIIPIEENERRIGQSRDNREHVDIVAKKTYLKRRKKIPLGTAGKSCKQCGRRKRLTDCCNYQ